MIRPLVAKWTTVALFVSLSVASALTQRASVAHPGYTGGGVTLLPNGWRIAPAGVHMAIGDLPLAMTFSPDGRSLIVTNNGMARPTLRVVNLEQRMVTQTFAMDDGWLGMAWHPDGGTFYSSGAAANSSAELKWQNGRFAPGSVIQLARSSRTLPTAAQQLQPNAAPPGPQSFIGGLAITPDGAALCAVHV